MLKRNFLAITIPVLIFGLALPLTAQGRRWNSQPAGALDLSDEQLVQIQELRIAFQKEILPLRNDIRIGYMELNQLHMQGAEQEKITAKDNALEKLEMELDKIHDSHQLQIRELLTDEQKVVFDEFGGLGMGIAYGGGYGMGFRSGNAAAWGRGRGMGRNPGRIAPRAYTRGFNRSTAYNRDFGRRAPRAWQRNTGRGFARGTTRGVMRGPGLGISRPPFHRRWWIR